MQGDKKESVLPVDARDIANYILDVADQNAVPITNLALQKILYFCQGNFLVHFEKHLFHNPIEAWKFGPVVRSVYESFRDFGSAPISARVLHSDALDQRVFAERFEPDSTTRDFLNAIILSFAKMSPSTLVDLTHTHGGPWRSAVQEHQQRANIGLRIDDEVIRARFQQSASVKPPTGFSGH
ncbi:MAG: type II toxin-antitoxin system antitoxin SocA domain-containing protein [Rhizomicrobium sp.]